MTSALRWGVGGQHHAPAALPPGKTRYPLYRSLGRPQGRSGRLRKISPPPGFDPRTVQPVASRYTDCAIPATLNGYRDYLPGVKRPGHGYDSSPLFSAEVKNEWCYTFPPLVCVHGEDMENFTFFDLSDQRI